MSDCSPPLRGRVETTREYALPHSVVRNASRPLFIEDEVPHMACEAKHRVRSQARTQTQRW